ncbi:ASCH domain-containing protein [Spiroplasma sp. DGKH1]|uniref:ASCH domain-containing protein n=1 Tax=Spiroplasma sp. DGKH1 TaxID=3050074 RepID=UPI0034C6D416
MSKAILLSIHPEFVEKILSGEKEYEFRKVITKHKPTKMIIYSTSPISKVVAEAEIEEIIIDKPEVVWNKTKKSSGIAIEFFFEYYDNKELAIAYKLKNVNKYVVPKELKEFGISTPPQSFQYLD